MLPKKLNNIDEYKNLPFEDWAEMFLLNHYLIIEESLINLEDLYKRKSLFSSFKMNLDPTKLTITAYDIYGNAIEDEELHIKLINNIGPLVLGDQRLYQQFSLFETIKRPERYELYKKIIGQDFYNRIIDSWEQKIDIDYNTIPKKSFEDLTYPLYLVSKEQIDNEDFNVMKQRFVNLNAKFAYLKCQQFLLTVDNLFKKNEKLLSVTFLFDHINQLQININFKEENTNLDDESANYLTPFVLEALNILTKKGEPLIFEADKLKEGYTTAYGNILEITGVNPDNEDLSMLLELVLKL